MTDDLRYPIGRCTQVSQMTSDMREAAIHVLAELPARMRDSVEKLSPAQLDTPYREGGWTVRQVVHHVPDSHANAYIRLKLALTEETPTVTAYDEQLWAGLPDSRMPVEISLKLVEGIHGRWVELLRTLKPEDWRRTFIHPEYVDGPRTIDWLLQQYSWHSRHHVAHITELRRREGWQT